MLLLFKIKLAVFFVKLHAELEKYILTIHKKLHYYLQKFEFCEGEIIKFNVREVKFLHCVKSVRIRSYSGPYFPAFGLNTGKMRTRITLNTDTFYAVFVIENG